MSLIDIVKKMRQSTVEHMSKVSREHDETKEIVLRDELFAKLNFEEPDRFTGKNNREKGRVNRLKIREITNGGDKYSVKDLLYSYHYDGRTSVWQYGVRIEDKEVSVREFSATKDGKTASFVLKKEDGSYHEHGDSNDAGDFYYGTANFSEYSNGRFSVPYDLDISDTNAVRYHFRKHKEIAHFFDKYVIVTPDERKAYKEYAKAQDNALALQKSQQDRLSGKTNE